MVMSDFSDGLEIRNIITGVTDRLDVDCSRLVVDGSDEVFRILALHELDGDVVLLQED